MIRIEHVSHWFGTFQVLHDGQVLAEKKFKVILPMN